MVAATVNLLEITASKRLAGINFAEFLRHYELNRARATFDKRQAGDGGAVTRTGG
jgi:hypothetical protein